MHNAMHRHAIGPQLVIHLARIGPVTDVKTVLLPMHCSLSHFSSFPTKMGGLGVQTGSWRASRQGLGAAVPRAHRKQGIVDHSTSKLVPHPQLLFALGLPTILNWLPINSAWR
jgi:hypothetical protein